MNGTSFLLLLVFLVAGYVLQPLALPKFQDSGYGLTEDQLKNKKNKGTQKPVAVEPTTPDPVAPRVTDEPVAPEVTDRNIPKVEPGPMPEPDPKPEPKPVELTENQLLDAMKQSVRSKRVTEFNFAQVKDWKFEGKQQINGQTYNVGVASYTAKTLFGDQTHEAKALYKNGKLVKWVWAANGFEMK